MPIQTAPDCNHSALSAPEGFQTAAGAMSELPGLPGGSNKNAENKTLSFLSGLFKQRRAAAQGFDFKKRQPKKDKIFSKSNEKKGNLKRRGSDRTCCRQHPTTADSTREVPQPTAPDSSRQQPERLFTFTHTPPDFCQSALSAPEAFQIAARAQNTGKRQWRQPLYKIALIRICTHAP
jgi:hypothetical protein